jgi:hypothetical protein
MMNELQEVTQSLWIAGVAIVVGLVALGWMIARIRKHEAHAVKPVRVPREPWICRHETLVLWLALYGFMSLCCAIGFAIWFPLGFLMAIGFGIVTAVVGCN